MFIVPLQWQSSSSTLLDANCTCRVGKVQSIFISGNWKLFRCSGIPFFRYSAFSSIPVCAFPEDDISASIQYPKTPSFHRQLWLPELPWALWVTAKCWLGLKINNLLGRQLYDLLFLLFHRYTGCSPCNIGIVRIHRSLVTSWNKSDVYRFCSSGNIANKVTYRIAGNFRGVQFSRKGELQAFRGLIFADGRSRTAPPTIPSWLRLLPHARAGSKTRV